VCKCVCVMWFCMCVRAVVRVVLSTCNALWHPTTACTFPQGAFGHGKLVCTATYCALQSIGKLGYDAFVLTRGRHGAQGVCLDVTTHGYQLIRRLTTNTIRTCPPEHHHSRHVGKHDCSVRGSFCTHACTNTHTHTHTNTHKTRGQR
jgi:hypothetical protein